jgi:hypothetical protein
MDMHDLTAYKMFRKNIKGLPTFCRVLMLELFEYIDLSKGKIILNKTLAQLALEDFFVEPAPGRKQEIITQNTIRNAFRTIKKFKGDFFHFKSVNQRIEIDIPFMRKLPKNLALHKKDAKEVISENCASQPIENKRFQSGHEQLKSKSFDRDDAAATLNQPAYITKNNNLTKTNRHEISDDFYPSEETIAIAIEHGLCKVEDTEEIKKFIAYNKQHKTQWPDFNPVFIKWLVREESYQAKKQQLIDDILETRTRSVSHASSLSASSQLPSDNRCKEFSDEIDFSQSAESIPCATPRGFGPSAHQLAFEANSSSVWEAFP